RYQVDPSLVKAVVWRESRFRASARGRVGEIGLMQIRELTGKEWAAAEKVSGFSARHLFDPETNTRVGAWYLAHLLKRYRETDNPAVFALADYNAGRTHVLRWNQGEAKTSSRAFLHHMDFPGTRDYVEAILNRCHHYHLTWHAAEK